MILWYILYYQIYEPKQFGLYIKITPWVSKQTLETNNFFLFKNFMFYVTGTWIYVWDLCYIILEEKYCLDLWSLPSFKSQMKNSVINLQINFLYCSSEMIMAVLTAVIHVGCAVSLEISFMYVKTVIVQRITFYSPVLVDIFLTIQLQCEPTYLFNLMYIRVFVNVSNWNFLFFFILFTACEYTKNSIKIQMTYNNRFETHKMFNVGFGSNRLLDFQKCPHHR